MSWWWWSHRASLGTGSGRCRPAAAPGRGGAVWRRLCETAHLRVRLQEVGRHCRLLGDLHHHQGEVIEMKSSRDGSVGDRSEGDGVTLTPS